VRVQPSVLLSLSIVLGVVARASALGNAFSHSARALVITFPRPLNVATIHCVRDLYLDSAAPQLRASTRSPLIASLPSLDIALAVS
jgi:hypothetical protein